MLTKEFTFRPVGTNENVLLEEDNYPWAMVHVDLFHTPRQADGTTNDIYTAIYKTGKPFKVRMTLEIIDE